MAKIALYARCSTTRQDLVSQRGKLEAWAAANGYDFDYFEDFAQSGMKTNREGVTRLKEKVAAGHYSLVAVVEMSRLGRSIADISAIIRDWSAKNCKVVLVNSGTVLDYATLEGRALIGALQLAAEIEWLLISERNARGRAKIKAEGIKVGRKPAPLSLEAIKALRAKGFGLRRIAKELGVSAPTVMRHLRNEDGHLPNVKQPNQESAASAGNRLENETPLQEDVKHG